MLSLAAPGLWWGLSAALLPVVIHLAFRRRFRLEPWGAMRFLTETHQRHRVRLQVERLVLLTLRTVVLLALAGALLRPQYSLERADGGRLPRDARVAAVLLLDDSISATAPRGDPAWPRMLALAAAYLDTLRPGDEVSVLRRSELEHSAADPAYDLAAVRQQVLALTPSAMASDQQRLVDAGLDQFARCLNPQAELVLVHDGRGDGFGGSASQWAQLRHRLSGPPGAVAGSRARPHLLVLAPPTGGPSANLGIRELRMARSVVSVDRPVALHVVIERQGDRAPRQVDAQLLVDGQVVEERRLALPTSGLHEAIFMYRFTSAGAHGIAVQLAGLRDDLPMDDRRAMAVEVDATVPVLLIEGQPGTDLDGSLGLLAAALDPVGDGRGLFRMTRISTLDLDAHALASTRVAVLGDAAALEVSAVAALERFVVGGGGLLVVTGPGTDPTLADRAWWRDGEGFLPARLDPVRRDAGRSVVPLADGHPALAPFAGAMRKSWAEISVTASLPLAGGGDALERLLRLDDGSTLLAVQPRGRGRVALLTTDLAGQWNNLPFSAAFVPAMQALIGHLGATALPPRNLTVGDSLAWLVRNEATVAQADGPEGTTVPLTATGWEGRPALVSGPLLNPGLWQVRASDQTSTYAVTVPASEGALQPIPPAQVASALAGADLRLATTPEQVTDLAGPGGSATRDLWPLLLAVAVLAFLAESGVLWWARRSRP